MAELLAEAIGEALNINMKYSINGSYILPNGIVVLVDEDVEAYFAGTLRFYKKNEIPELG